MRVATRVGAGSGLLLALLCVVLAYHVTQVDRLVRANRALASVTFRASTVALDLGRRVDQLDEYVRKLFVVRDHGYAEQVAASRDAVASRLRELTVLGLSAPEEEAVRGVRDAWRRFPLATADADALLLAANGAQRAATLAAALDTLELMRLRVQQTIAASQDTVAATVVASTDVGESVTRVTVAVIAIALLISLVAVAWTVRSIAAPLRRLTRATHAVAAGTFSTRIEVSGDDELARLGGDFNSMVRRLGELDQLKRDFVSHVSHELKTPLVAMQETTALLLEEAPGPLAPKQRRLLELNLQASRRLSGMIANLLDLSRLEAGTMNYEIARWSIAEIVRTAVAEYEVFAAERGVGLVVAAPGSELEVACDRDRVIQVVHNLLDNAVKFSRAGDTVRVVVTRDGASAAKVAVEDRGPGIPDVSKGEIFERFRQIATDSRRPGAGVGLGLALCRQMVVAMGGSITVADNPAGGAVFTFTLPVAEVSGGRT